MTTHDLKIWPENYAPVEAGDKTFEVRKNDRGYKVGDRLKLREWSPIAKEYTSRVVFRSVTYVSTSPYLELGYVILGIQRVTPGPNLYMLHRSVVKLISAPFTTTENTAEKIIALVRTTLEM